MWFLSILFLSFGLQSSFSLKDCSLIKKWIPNSEELQNRRFDEIYSPVDAKILPMAFFLLVINSNPPILTIQSVEKPEKDNCLDANFADWYATNMSFITNTTIVGCSRHFDWETILIYFNEKSTLGILTECSGPRKIHHVLYSYKDESKIIPSKREVQDLAMRFEGKKINLNNTSEDILTFEIDLGASTPKCLCDVPTTIEISSYYVVLASVILFIVIVLCVACSK